MNVSLTPELEELVNEKVRSGMYNSASEVVRESLRLLKEHDDLQRLRVEELRREIQVGLKQLDRGEGQLYPSARALVEEIKAGASSRKPEGGK